MTTALKDLAPISIDILYDGMVVDYGIYYREEDTYVLLCKDVILTPELIKGLVRAAVGKRNVYIDKQYHSRILSGSEYLKNIQKRLEESIGYDKVRDKASSLIDVISENGKVPELTVSLVVDGIEDTLTSTDTSIIMQCLNGVREVDQYLYTHSTNVGMLNGLMARWLKLDSYETKTLIKVGLMHDIGKLRVPAGILNQPRKLSESEFLEVKNHPIYSQEILKESGETNALILRGVMQHHEKMNGKGYPYGLKADEISFYARVTSVCDVYDAMVAEREYKSSHSPFEIFEEFSKGRYSHLDIELVNLFLKNMPLELLGKPVYLSNGSIGVVSYVNPNDYGYPIVSIDGTIIQTNSEIYCISMYAEINS